MTATTIPERNKAHAMVDMRPAIFGGIVVIALVLFGLVGWAGTAPVASAVIAQGIVVVDGKRKEVQHLEGGIVQTILVRDGTKVGANQILVRLDEARARNAWRCTGCTRCGPCS